MWVELGSMQERAAEGMYGCAEAEEAELPDWWDAEDDWWLLLAVCDCSAICADTEEADEPADVDWVRWGGGEVVAGACEKDAERSRLRSSRSRSRSTAPGLREYRLE